MTLDSIFVTTSIPYVNGPPHVGFAWELVLADCLARYHRLRGANVVFLTGTDDNSLKTVQAAEREGRATAEFVSAQGQRFVSLALALGLSNDDFIRTAFDPRHTPAVEKLWQACADAGDVYSRSYSGSYCTGCEQFYAPNELVLGRCPEHDAPLEIVDESNYFFRLSRHQDHVDRALSSGGLRVFPEVYRRETYQWVERGLADFSISRSTERAKGWGIGVPGDASQIVYVWFDALANYISALDYAAAGPRFLEHWQESARRIHVIGKNVTRFHCVYWPAILASAGVRGPSDVVVHGFLTVEGRKIGKSLGNGVDPFALLERFGADRLRYYLLRHFPLGHDGDFSSTELVRASNAGLADQLGNLLQRVLVLIQRSAGGVVPPLVGEAGPLSNAALAATLQAVTELERCAPDQALAGVFGLVEAANLELSRTEPWKVARRLAASQSEEERGSRQSELDRLLGEAARALLWIAGLLEPFLPNAAERIGCALGAPLPLVYRAVPPDWAEVGRGARIVRGDILFSRLPLEEGSLLGPAGG
jgi:methionyl-tRNA synthetase